MRKKIVHDFNLNDIRQRIQGIDYSIMSLIQQRISLAKQVGRIKQDLDLPIRNFQVEKQVFLRIQRYADEFNLDPAIAKKIYTEVIKASVNVQLENHVIIQSKKFKKCLVYGGNGKMGKWMVHFLRTSGHEVDVKDPSVPDLIPKELDYYDFIILATPLRHTKIVLEEIIKQNPGGIIFDIASLKSKLIQTITNAQAAGLKVGSIHPMFGPDVISLEDRNLVICETDKNHAVNIEIEALFRDTSVNLVHTSLLQHDDYMSYSLGLSHFLNLLFGKILHDSDHQLDELLNFASTTFSEQLKTTKEVFSENPALYQAIQTENDYTDFLNKEIAESVNLLMSTIKTSSETEFINWMTHISKFLNNKE